MHRTTTALLGLLSMVTLAAAGCRDSGLGAPGSDGSTNLPHGSVQAAVLADTTAGDGSITFIVRVMARDVVVSSYQGVVTFTPGAFTLVSTSTPAGLAGETYVLNPTGFAEGRIRFAALTTTAFSGVSTGSGVEAFRFTVRPVSLGSQSGGVTATLEVVGTDLGRAVAADRVLASPGVQMLTAPIR